MDRHDLPEPYATAVNVARFNGKLSTIDLVKIPGATGDREVWFRGERWGRLRRRGGRYSCYTIEDANGHKLNDGRGDREWNDVRFRKPRSKWRDETPPDAHLSTEDYLCKCVKGLIESGKISSPAALKAAADADSAKWERINAEERVARDRMRALLFRLAGNSDHHRISAHDVQTLRMIYEEAFSAPMQEDAQ